MGNSKDTGRKLKNWITSSQVAKHAAVSQSAVSRAFTPGASVAPETREKVLLAAQQLGYRPNAIARSLISGRSRMIGLLAPYFGSPFYPIVLEGLARALQLRGYHTLLFITDTEEPDQQLEKILAYQVDGVVMLSSTLSSALARECLDASIPVVLFDRDVPDASVSSVVSDNEAGGRLVGNHLMDVGRKRIAFISGDENYSTSQDREKGLAQSLAERGMQIYARRVGDYSFDRAVVAAEQLMQLSEPPDAIFVASDQMAFAVLDTLRSKLGIAVPGQVAIVGFDDVPQAASAAYSLTTVTQSTDALVDTAVSLLFEQLETGRTITRQHCLPVTLVQRGTT